MKQRQIPKSKPFAPRWKPRQTAADQTDLQLCFQLKMFRNGRQSKMKNQNVQMQTDFSNC
jgi:hypothetical protein